MSRCLTTPQPTRQHIPRPLRRALVCLWCMGCITWFLSNLSPTYAEQDSHRSPIVDEIARQLTDKPLSAIRGVNYLRPTGYDADQCPDLQFGQDSICPWDIEAITADMHRLQELGVNTVRIFLNYYTFGGASKTNAEYDMAEALGHLDTFIDVAQQHNIQVLPVLLSKYPQDRFTLADLDVALSVHVRPVMRHLAPRSGIVAWDLFNEPDIGSPVDQRCWDWANGDHLECLPLAEERLLFLRRLRQEVRLFDTERPVTIGMAFAKSYFQPTGTTFFADDLVEFYSFHYYDNDPYDSGRYAEHWYYGQGFPDDLVRGLTELHNLGSNKPIVITELGFPTGAGHMREQAELRRDLARSREVAQGFGAGLVLWPFQDQPEELIGDLFTAPPATP